MASSANLKNGYSCAAFSPLKALLIISIMSFSSATKSSPQAQNFPTQQLHNLRQNLIQNPIQRMKRRVQQCTPTSNNVTELLDILRRNASQTEFLRVARGGYAYHFPPNRPLFSGSSAITVSPTTSMSHHTHLNSSLCPFNLVIRRLPAGYYPSTIFFAHCSCHRCRDHSVMGCVQVITDLIVFRPNGCRQGMQVYEEQVLPVPTSCACASSGRRVESTASSSVAGISGGSEPTWGQQ